MDTRPVSELRPHPKNAEIYGDRADNDLVESVRTKGVLNPLLITRDGRIISGHRRHDAARRANLADVPVVVFASRDELDILEAVIESNRNRIKNGEMVGREYRALLGIEQERARLRQSEAAEATNDDRWGSLSLPQNSAEAIDPSPADGCEWKGLPVAVPARVGPATRHAGSPAAPVKGEARKLAAEKVGVSHHTAERAAKVVTVIDRLTEEGKEREARQLREALNGKSVNKAFTVAQERGLIEKPQPKPEPPRVEMPVDGTKEHVTLAEWRAMDEGGRTLVLNRPWSKSARFNEQKDNSIEWALWSWNPVTGCLHNCSYCYARDIANRFYDWKFVPAFLPSRLGAPHTTKVPEGADTRIGLKNVFTCSMADLFGKWVPREWIDAVLDSVRQNPQWNFLFLTKFPTRLAEFDFPDNAWVGTSVDAQARVANAEKAFANVRAKVKWLSCEPLLEPLTFSRLDIFDWIVIGGASASTETPAFRPPREWVIDLETQARNAGCRIYEKENLHPLGRLTEYPGYDTTERVNVADAFKMGYLVRDIVTPERYADEVATPPALIGT